MARMRGSRHEGIGLVKNRDLKRVPWDGGLS